MLTMQGFGAVTEVQLAAAKNVMRGCALPSEVEGVVAQLTMLLKTYPDPADRLAIQRVLTVYTSDTSCRGAVQRAFAALEPPPKTSSFNFTWLIAGGAGLLLGGVGGYLLGRRRSK